MTEQTSGLDLGLQEAKTELQEFLHGRDDRHRLFPRAALVGLLSGLCAVAFRSSLAFADSTRNQLVTWSHAIPSVGWIFPMFFTATGALGALLVVRRWGAGDENPARPDDRRGRRHRPEDLVRCLRRRSAPGCPCPSTITIVTTTGSLRRRTSWSLRPHLRWITRRSRSPIR